LGHIRVTQLDSNVPHYSPHYSGGKMLTHKLQTKIYKRGYLELRNLPFMEGTQIEIIISKKKRKKNLQKLICNDHVWTKEDIKAVERGREIINQWKIS